MSTSFIKLYSDIRNKDIAEVGGKNASLGEMIHCLTSKGINVPDGFATTAAAYRLFLLENKLEEPVRNELDKLDTKNFSNLDQVSKTIREMFLKAKIPYDVQKDIRSAYAAFCKRYGRIVDVAVRSSATAEDLPTASFAGQHESYLNVKGEDEIIDILIRCYASLFNARAIKYRCDNGFDHLKVLLSIGVQLMVRSDQACSGVCFTLDPESGFRDVILISGCWGLGENIVQGAVNPDEFYVFKPTLRKHKQAIISRKMGSKNKMMVYAKDGENGSTVNEDTPAAKQQEWVLNDGEITRLAQWCMLIEEHYRCPMDIEWAKDGKTGLLFIVQARPETVHSHKDPYLKKEYELESEGTLLLQGNAVGTGITSGPARIILSPADAWKLQPGEILVTDITNPDWDPILKKAAAIVTNKGGRTSHAAIVAREMGAIAVVGCVSATSDIKEGQVITVSCIHGKTGRVYEGKASWTTREINFRDIKTPNTPAMLILGDPDKAFRYSFYPNSGIGLMRLEFIINHSIRVHPMALVKFNELKDREVREEIARLTGLYDNKEAYFTDKLSQAVATIAAAFYPKDVIVRMSDFKTNEYANLLGGKSFEPEEENPMLGFRGASRYYNERYREGFRLECEAMRKVRGEMGFTNVKLMIPFCRTPEEGKKVISLMERYGLKRGDNGLEIYVMAEIPSNVLLAESFAEIFDGFSIGSNDLTQLTLGLDRDSAIISELFDENNPAVKQMIDMVIETAKNKNVKVGLCGQAPSDSPEFTKFLIARHIDSISFNPDALFKGMENMVQAEEPLLLTAGME